MRCALLCYLVLFFVAYIAFVGAAPPGSAKEAAPQGSGGQVSIRLNSVQESAQFEVHGLPRELLERLSQRELATEVQSVFTVSVARPESDELSPMLGTSRVIQNRLVFEPRFPLVPGVTYVANLLPFEATGRTISQRFTLPKPRPETPTALLNVFPTSPELPENQLKFYLFFSRPMSRGQAYRHLGLFKENGEKVEGAFLEIAEELWDPTGTRFTLLMDPGRVKRGLKPREEDGPILEEGHRYTLIVDQAWSDAAGFELKEPVKKTFAVLAPDDEPLDTANWKIEAPADNNDHTLSVIFPEPVDRALLERVLWVETSDGARVAGTVTIDRQETRWRFQPVQSWNDEATYLLAVERILEDRAGNRIGRKFEVDVFDKIDRQVQPDIIRLPIRAEP